MLPGFQHVTPNQQHVESVLKHGGWKVVSVAVQLRPEFEQRDEPGQPVTATGATLSTTDSVTNGPQRFYRLMLVP